MPDTFSLSNASAAEAPRGNFDRAIVDEVWDLAEVVAGNDPVLWRQDADGSTIRRSDYGKHSASYGWEVVDGSDGLKAVHFDNL